ILLLYLGLTVAEIFLLNLGDMDIFESICHSFSTISTGGFSVKNSSLTHYSAYSQYVVLIFMILAGTSQVVYYYLLKRNFRKVSHNEELLFYVAIVIIAGALASGILLINTTKPPEEALREGYFQIVSTLTTTGFSSTNFDLWPKAGIFVIFVMMFAGGCTGSSSGGIKIARHLIVLKNIKNALTRLNHPNTVTSIKLNGKVISENMNISILSFIVLYLFIFVIGSVIVVATGVNPVSASSSVASCMAAVGPAIGGAEPFGNFSGLPELSKLVLSFLMIIGRLEIITVFVIFSRSFWKL
ncbi:MAG: potassium transporter TrkG, partial [Bacteroidales bacterium]